jgi:hypothetical protein
MLEPRFSEWRNECYASLRDEIRQAMATAEGNRHDRRVAGPRDPVRVSGRGSRCVVCDRHTGAISPCSCRRWKRSAPRSCGWCRRRILVGGRHDAD